MEIQVCTFLHQSRTVCDSSGWLKRDYCGSLIYKSGIVFILRKACLVGTWFQCQYFKVLNIDVMFNWCHLDLINCTYMYMYFHLIYICSVLDCLWGVWKLCCFERTHRSSNGTSVLHRWKVRMVLKFKFLFNDTDLHVLTTR